MIVVDTVADVKGKIIHEHPYIKVLSVPRLEVYEIVPGWSVERWEALAQVNETLCVVELVVREQTWRPS